MPWKWPSMTARMSCWVTRSSCSSRTESASFRVALRRPSTSSRTRRSSVPSARPAPTRPSATRPALTVPERAVDYAGFLRTAHSDAFQGRAVAEWALEQGFAKVATIHDGSAYAEALVDVFRTEYQTLGGQVAAPQAVSKG